jgi:glucose-1-phosphate adenylyltransferase
MDVDENGMITDFIEKPADPPAMPGNPDMSLCSMGVYVFNAKYLYAELARDIPTRPPITTSARTSFHAPWPTAWRSRTPFSRSCVMAPDEPVQGALLA